MKNKIKKMSSFMYLVTDVAMMIGIIALVGCIAIPIVSAIELQKAGYDLNNIQMTEKTEDVLSLNDIAGIYNMQIIENNDFNFKALVIVFTVRAVETALLIVMLYNLSKLFRNVKNSETPFEKENSKYLKRVSILILSAVILPKLGAFIAGQILNVRAPLTIGIANLIYALAVISVTQVFEYGCELQKESDETL